ncbi:MAG: helix-hairpin-helix domain-containing protein [Myxococcaceae bacterium]|nr:helix-hairpin-helix domain-containing protein [Myxococcaceae bacterium]
MSFLSLHPRQTLLSTAFLVAFFCATQASAVQYESEIDIESEQDLYDLQLEGDISEETLETLLALFQSGVDLNTASPEEIYELPSVTYEHVNAIIEYRKAANGIQSPEALVAAGVLDEQLLLQILPFISLSEVSSGKGGGARRAKYISGNVKYGIAGSSSDTKAPPMFLRTRLKGPFNLKAGLLLMTARNMIDGIYESEGQLYADRPGYSFHVPKYYVEWKQSHFSLIAGTYRIGFGERLTLDNTTKSTPNGFYADDAYNTPQELASACRESKGDSDPDMVEACDGLQGKETGDYTWSHGFRGLAASGSLPLSDLTLKGTVFISYEDKAIYQYEIYDTAFCDDPRGSNGDCSAPSIYVTKGEGLKHGYRSIPSIYRELAGGGNVTLKISEVAFVGLTGYGAKSTFDDLGDYNLDFQEWSRMPYGGPYGAIGVNGGAYLGKFSLFAEVARSFDSMHRGVDDMGNPIDGPGGGFAVIQRTVFTPVKKQELELTLRYYGRDFANPYSRATAAADEYQGLRGRNEAGARLRYHGRLPDWVLSGQVDYWLWPEDALTYDYKAQEEIVDTGKPKGTQHLQLKARAQFVGFDLVQPWLSFDYRNRDLAFNDNSYKNKDEELIGSCYDAGSEYNEDGASVNCRGQFYRVGVGARIEPLSKRLWFDLRYQHEFLNDRKYPDGLRQDSIFSLSGTVKPLPELSIRARFRYLYEDIQDNTAQEQSIWAYLAVTYNLMKQFSFNVRYDFYYYLDERESTLERSADYYQGIARADISDAFSAFSEHRFRFDFEAKF